MPSSVVKGSSIRALYRHISARRKLQFKSLLGLTVLASFAEIISLGAVVPFIAVVTQSEKIFSYPFMEELGSMLRISSSQDMVAPIALLFVTAAVFAGILRIVVLKTSIKLSNSTGADISSTIFRRTLYQQYSVHISRNSSDVISGITQKVATATMILTSIITVITNFILFVAILSALLIIDPEIALGACLAFGSIYIGISLMAKSALRSNGTIIARKQTDVVKASQEGLGAIRDIILDNNQEYFAVNYGDNVQELQKAVGSNQFITLAPRYVMEALALALIGFFTFYVADDSVLIASAMPTLGALALGAQRMLPILQQLYGNFSFISGSEQSLKDVLRLLDQPVSGPMNGDCRPGVSFKKRIDFQGVGFRYSDSSPLVLSDIDFVINKGSSVGLVGETGSGKSTAVDILMTMLMPSTGTFSVDGVEINTANMFDWKRAVAHVPQHIFLADASIAENIAFGVPADNIDYERLRRVGEQAQLHDLIEEFVDGYSTIVGERGVNLSGGQIQRIGIARALYKDVKVLILDEATSALDSETEARVMQSITSLDSELTLVMIAHRISTLAKCDRIFKFSKSDGVEIINYSELNNQ